MNIDFLRPKIPKLFGVKKYLAAIYRRNWFTNYGPVIQEFEKRMKDYFNYDTTRI